MVEKPLEIGDLVQLKSGGPITTVTGIDRNQADEPIDVRVQWFGPADELRMEYFPPSSLRISSTERSE